MLSWAVGFFLAAIVAGVFGFGAVASSFMGIAQVLFYVFLILFAISLIASFFFRPGHTADGVAHGPAFGGFGALAGVALIAVLAYAWFDNDMSAERLGRMIDRGAANMTADASDAIAEAGSRVDEVAEDTTDSVRDDTVNFFETASDNVRNAE